MFMDIKKIATLSLTELHCLVDHIGNTAMLPMRLVIRGVAHTIFLKLEGSNPTGSMKDRTGLALIRQIEENDLITGRPVIVESTSGNLGVALALLCKARGYDFLAVVDPKTTPENLEKMRLLGAQIEVVNRPDETGGYLLSRLARIRELCAQSASYIWTNQYGSPANPLIHFTTTGPEIYRQMIGKVGAIFIPVSTGGTLAGVARFFREVSPSTQIIGVDACGSVVFGTPPGPRKLNGIGSSRPSSFLSSDLYDAFMLVRDEEAFAFCRFLSLATNVKVGGSSGAVLSACAKYLAAHPQMEQVVCLCADDGENYASSIFNDEWLKQQHLNLSPDHLEMGEAIEILSAQSHCPA